MAEPTGLEPAVSCVTGRVKWFYNNSEQREDCQTQRKSKKTIKFVGWKNRIPRLCPSWAARKYFP
jgi:hypothetical protein